MKTEETKRIESMFGSYDSSDICGYKVDKFRPRHTVFECPCPSGGIVDVLRISEVQIGSNMYSCGASGEMGVPEFCEMLLEGSAPPKICTCGADCILAKKLRVTKEKLSTLFSCYEIKVSEQDFKSTHGHNLIGNANYYVIPKEMLYFVEHRIAPEIGIIVSTETGLRRYREALYTEISDETKMFLLLAAMKRMENGGGCWIGSSIVKGL